MRITELRVQNLRIIRELMLSPSPGINFIVGANGAGKTSVLEALYLAGRGRSFRHAKAGPLIRRGETETIVVAKFSSSSSDEVAPLRVIGVERGKSALRCRLDGKDVHRRSELADAIPVQWISSQPQLLLELGPDIRRRFIDMGLFHVERDYLSTAAEFNRYLKQRNAALRSHDIGMAKTWEPGFVDTATRIDLFRRKFVDRLLVQLNDILTTWCIDLDLGFRYRSGWPADESLQAALTRKHEVDARMGFTSVGPQRAELEFVAAGVPADKILSRGQQKMLVFALNFAMFDLILADTGKRPLLLIDDLAAELDDANQAILTDSTVQRKIQAFITSIRPPSSADDGTFYMFHVEHGELRAT